MTIDIDKNFWLNKKVFVTGDTGFKGSWLVFWLLKLGANIKGYSLDPNENSFYGSLNLGDRYHSVRADIRDIETLRKEINNFSPDIIFHLAAQPLVRNSYEDPLYTFEVNVIGTTNILDVFRQSLSIQTLINITSDKCYQNNNWHWGYRENDPLGGHDPYSNSKACSELVTQSYRDSYINSTDKVLASVRAGNVIGGGDWSQDRLVPDIIKSLFSGDDLNIRNPLSTRPWQHVLEPISFYILLAQKSIDSSKKDIYSSPWNIGPYVSNCLSVSEIIKRFEQYFPNLKWGIDSGDNHPYEAKFLSLDISKSKQLMGWSPRLDIDETIKMTAEWYQGYFANDDLDLISCKQVDFFTEKE